MTYLVNGSVFQVYIYHVYLDTFNCCKKIKAWHEIHFH